MFHFQKRPSFMRSLHTSATFIHIHEQREKNEYTFYNEKIFIWRDCGYILKANLTAMFEMAQITK